MTQHEWISATVPPDIDRDVLVLRLDLGVPSIYAVREIASFDIVEGEGAWFDGDGEPIGSVIAWRDLPAKPDERAVHDFRAAVNEVDAP